jgi:hypothetical protein
MSNTEPEGLTREQCLAKAQWCRELAKEGTLPEHAPMLEEIAETWEQMAMDFSIVERFPRLDRCY